MNEDVKKLNEEEEAKVSGGITDEEYKEIMEKLRPSCPKCGSTSIGRKSVQYAGKWYYRQTCNDCGTGFGLLETGQAPSHMEKW